MEMFPTPPGSPVEVPTGGLFCGQDLSGQRAREHVFPQWLLRDFDLVEAGVAPLHMSTEFTFVSRRLHKLSGLVEGHICETCNGGWMSDLEGEARSILGPLIAGTRDLEAFDRRARLVLARWTLRRRTC
jgi:hypothetical protein